MSESEKNQQIEVLNQLKNMGLLKETLKRSNNFEKFLNKTNGDIKDYLSNNLPPLVQKEMDKNKMNLDLDTIRNKTANIKVSIDDVLKGRKRNKIKNKASISQNFQINSVKLKELDVMSPQPANQRGRRNVAIANPDNPDELISSNLLVIDQVRYNDNKQHIKGILKMKTNDYSERNQFGGGVKFDKVDHRDSIASFNSNFSNREDIVAHNMKKFTISEEQFEKLMSRKSRLEDQFERKKKNENEYQKLEREQRQTIRKQLKPITRTNSKEDNTDDKVLTYQYEMLEWNKNNKVLNNDMIKQFKFEQTINEIMNFQDFWLVAPRKIKLQKIFKKCFDSENWIKKVAIYDRRSKRFNKITPNTIKAFLLQKFPPNVIEKMFKFLNLNSIHSVDDFRMKLNELIRWDAHRIFQFCFAVLNVNEVGDIDANDLMLQINSVQSTDPTVKDVMFTDIFKLVRYILDKMEKNKTKNIEMKTWKVARSQLSHALDVKVPSLVDINEVIESIANKRSNNFNSDVGFGINQQEFVTQIDWTIQPIQNDKWFASFPNIQVEFVQTILDCELFEVKYILQEIDDKVGFFEEKTFDFIDAYYQFNNERIANGLNIDSDSRFNYMYWQYGEYGKHFKLMSSSQFRMCGPDYRCTPKQFKDQLDGLVGIKMKRVSDHIFDLLSYNTETINQQKFARCMDWIKGHPMDFLMELISITTPGQINSQDLQQFIDMFAFAPYVKLDFVLLIEGMKVLKNSSHLTIGKLNMILAGYSRFSNMLLLILQGCEKWWQYATDPKGIEGLHTFHKMFIGFQPMPDNELV